MHVNETNFHVKGFALGLALKQTKATRKSPIRVNFLSNCHCLGYYYRTLVEKGQFRIYSFHCL